MADSPERLRLTLGPLLWYWPREAVFEFYRQVESWPVDRVCLGEIVCNRRREMKLRDWLAIGRSLQDAGKEVRLATGLLVESAGDLRDMYRVCEQDEFPLEVNEQSAIEVLHRAGRPFSAGPGLNIYNSASLAVLAEDGLESWCPPVEMCRESLARLLERARQRGLAVDCEVLAWGPLPLAIAARCMSARHYERPKEDCGFVCRDHPAGLPLYSREQERLFILNGVQTLSGSRFDLLAEVPRMRGMGVAGVRVTPEAGDMGPLLERFRRACDGEPVPADPLALVDVDACNGYWYGKPGREWASAPGE